MKNIALCLSAVLLFSSCTAIRYGRSSKITILSPEGTDNGVEVVVKGSQEEIVHHNVSLPYRLKVKHSNLPVTVSVTSPDVVYADRDIETKTVGSSEAKAWMVPAWLGLVAEFGGIIPICVNPEGDHLAAATVIGGGAAVGMASAFIAMACERDVPKYSSYALKTVSPSSDTYRQLQKERPLIRYDEQHNYRELVCDGLTYQYTDNGGSDALCRLITEDSLVVIGFDRGYSDIRPVTQGRYRYYAVEKTIGGKTYRGACDLMGVEMVAPQKKRLRTFGSILALKAKKPLANMESYVCTMAQTDDLFWEINKEAVKLADDQRYDEAVEKLKWSIYLNSHPMNDAYYLLGHYYCFGTFGQEALEGRTVQRNGLQPVDPVKGMDYLTRSLSSFTGDVFADRTAWTYNPEKAIRQYVEYSGGFGDVHRESEKIAGIFRNDRDFVFDVEYFFNQIYSEKVNDKEFTSDVGDLMVFLPGKLDTIATLVDKIPGNHRSAVLNLTRSDSKTLAYLGMKHFNDRQFGRALYYFRRGAYRGDEVSYIMSVMTLDSIARTYCTSASNYEVAAAFADFWPYGNGNGRFKQKEEEFKTYYNEVCEVIEEEEKRRQEEEAQAERERAYKERLRKEARRQRNLAIFGDLLQGISQGVQNYYTVKNQSTTTRRITRRTSALDTQIPEAFNPQRVAAMCEPVYSYDSNGKLMVSYPGFAQALGEMDAEIMKTTNQVAGQLRANGDSYSQAKAHYLTTITQLNHDINMTDQLMWATPLSFEDRAALAEDDNEGGGNGGQASGQRNKDNRTATDKASVTDKTTQGNDKLKDKTGSEDKKNAKEIQQQTGDAKQQFHSGKVESDDYKEEKKNLTLYLRDGDKAKAFLRNCVLYRKGATYYVKVSNTFYRVGYSNWSRFNRSIVYGAHSVYFDM